MNGYEAVIRDVKGCGRGVGTRWDLGCRLTVEGNEGVWGVEGSEGVWGVEGSEGVWGVEGSEGVCGRCSVKQTGIIRILRGPSSSSFWVPRNLSNRMDRQACTRDTVLVKR